MNQALVIIPTYNEKENIERVLRLVFELPRAFHVLVVDDNSPDGTAQIVKGLQKEFPQALHILERPGKQGLGRAYIAGFEWAIARDYEFICEMDADLSHNPADLVRLVKACEESADVAIGSRYITGVNVVNWPIGRVLMSYYASAYVRMVTGMPFRDATAGFICYRKRVLTTIPLDKVKFKGYAFQIEMKFSAWKYGFKIVEVPIIFTDRTEGKSKMSKGIFKEAIFGVFEIKMKSWFGKYSLDQSVEPEKLESKTSKS